MNKLDENQKSRLINYDKLTGVFTMEKFENEFARLLRNNPTNDYSIMMMDIRQFKLINEYYGHQLSDQVLVNITKYISSFPDILLTCRQSNTDHFFFLVEADKDTIISRIKSFCSSFNPPVKNLKVSFNFGISKINRSNSFREVINKVTSANSEAKKSVFSNYCFYNEKLVEKETYEQLLINSFDEAIEKEEFELYIQPKFDLALSTFFGGEVLVRWRKGDKMISPGDFIPLFEDNGLIATLDRYVLIQTLKILQK